MKKDIRPYYIFTSKSRLDKSINSLLGIVEGISADLKINDDELNYLAQWISEQEEYQTQHPFNELIPIVSNALKDSVLSIDERDDIVWLCEKLRSTEYYEVTTADMQRLHALMGGIAGDGMITVDELSGLSDWLSEHEHLKTCWPYDEVDSIITAVLADKRIDEKEHGLLMTFFSEFVSTQDNRVISQVPEPSEVTLQGLCAVCPEIEFENSVFCFTGASSKRTRKELNEIVTSLGGKVTNSISSSINYLVIGADGNPCWAYACYGRKVEAAVNLRRQGKRLLIVHENDFNDAVADKSSR
ncbi:MAG TPA: BRCT domain-containing protein [Anaerolineales bacterium]|nr:BRCT domain-containing protein [Anaerolineales bacterium]HNO31381.1 BRCT domain-containing protein [Anaerolineales bacterium]